MSVRIAPRGAPPGGGAPTTPAPRGAAPSTAGGDTKRSHLFAIDLARVFAVALVVSVHTLSFASARISGPVGAFIMVFHSSREVFFLLTTLVLTYNYGRRPIRWWSFWRRRYWLILPPYVTWSFIYFLADGEHLDPISAAARAFAHDLLTAGARYHLYFLLVTMQIYLAYPLLRWLLKKTEHFHAVLFGVALAYELAVTWAVQHDLHGPGPIGFWMHNPNALLPSYVFYVIAGGLAGWHLDELVAFTRRRRREVALVITFGLACGLAGYFAQLTAGRTAPVEASAVFQPAVVLESVAIGWLFFAAGLAWEHRGMPWRGPVAAGADVSFGIFLAHPLVLQYALEAAKDTGVLAAVHGLPVGLELVVLLGVAVPVVYGIAAGIALVGRQTPFSLVMAGRPAPATRSLAAALAGLGGRRRRRDLGPETDLLTSPPAAAAGPVQPDVVAVRERAS